MKLIFLDIDGVLNAHEPLDADVLCATFHRDKVALLNGVLRATGAKIVLSSAWRYIVHRGEATLDGMDWLLRSHGVISGRLFGVTPIDTMMPWLKKGTFDGEPSHWPKENERGKQITDWLTADYAPPCSRHVVIDDLDLGISAAGHPFVQTDGKVGLTAADAEKVLKLLGNTEV